MTGYIEHAGLQVAQPIHQVIEQASAGAGVPAQAFWDGLARIVAELGPENARLLARRDELQARLDEWHGAHPGGGYDIETYKKFLSEIGYLVPEGGDFTIDNGTVDPEISQVAGPQLVVPITNARYALNAANARWGSLYDALYGTDLLPEEEDLAKGPDYNPARGLAVMHKAMAFLDRVAPLDGATHDQVVSYQVVDGDKGLKKLVARLEEGTRVELVEPGAFAGYVPGNHEPQAVLLINNGLGIELSIDRQDPVGRDHPAGLRDVLMESAVTTILDLEDSVAVVDANDKALAYANLAGLMRGDLETTFAKGGRTVSRRLAEDRAYVSPSGGQHVAPGRSLMLVRNVGGLIHTDAVLDGAGRQIPESFLDAMATAFFGRMDLTRAGRFANSRQGNIYIVKPKMHGPEEVAFACRLFAMVEEALDLEPGTLKIGVMDEERRTTLNLKECIRAARERIIFINTGFLDRTGDEIHTLMEAGPMVRKADMKSEAWMLAYEDWNVDVGLACGFSGRAQIGKGMWAKPNAMREMVETKAAHPEAGANCAWVPSPTAATLHAMHYHQVDVRQVQKQLAKSKRARLDDLLRAPVLDAPPEAADVRQELDGNAQSILGYVVRWVEQGVGCSTVPDLSDVGLMEDRATLRISSQHMANWLRHGVADKDQVEEALRRMARVVDRQNQNDPAYRPMAADFEDSVAFQAARDLVLSGREQPNGYTEPVLHARRREAKAKFGLA